jgi:hypothetical protein
MTEVDDAPRVRRLCISVDIERYSRWDAEDQHLAQTGLNVVLDGVARRCDPPRSSWTRQPTGDGELAVLPPGIDEGQIISDFVRELAAALYRHNRRLSEDARIRLRVGMHAGMTRVSDLGFAGRATVLVARLRDCPQVREILTRHRAAPFAVVISQQLYDDHIGHDYPDFNASSFRRIRAEIPEKSFAADAWVYLSAWPDEPPDAAGEPPIPRRPDGDAPTDGRRSTYVDQRSGGVYVSGGRLKATNVAGGDLRPER